jgi:hypothetical protein
LKNENEESKENPETGNLLFDFKVIFSKKNSLEDIARKNNYGINWSFRFGTICVFIFCAEKRGDRIISK